MPHGIIILNPRLPAQEQSILTMDTDWWKDLTNHCNTYDHFYDAHDIKPKGGAGG